MVRQRICFVDDDPAEVATFSRLYGATFEIVGVQATSASTALDAITAALAGRPPDLFVLDLYFPLTEGAPTGLADPEAAGRQAAAVAEMAVRLGREARAGGDGKPLLRQAHDVVTAARRVLDDWCAQMDQSPQGGLQVLARLNEAHPGVPKVFYSRKATLQDGKDALDAGALDILAKPPSSEETHCAAGLTARLETYAGG